MALGVGCTGPCAEGSCQASSVLIGSGWLQTGAVLNRVFEIHESHIPYLLQFKVSTFSLVGHLQPCAPVHQQVDMCLDCECTTSHMCLHYPFLSLRCHMSVD